MSGAEIQPSVVDTKTAVCVSTWDIFKIVLRETENSSRRFRVVAETAPLNIFWGKYFPRENWAKFSSEGKFSLSGVNCS